MLPLLEALLAPAASPPLSRRLAAVAVLAVVAVVDVVDVVDVVAAVMVVGLEAVAAQPALLPMSLPPPSASRLLARGSFPRMMGMSCPLLKRGNG